MTELTHISKAVPKHRGTLRTKVAAWFLFVSVIPIVAMAIIVVTIIDATARRYVSDLETQLLRQKTAEIAKFMTEIREPLDLQVGDVVTPFGKAPFESFSSITEDQTHLFLQNVLESDASFQEVALFDLANRSGYFSNWGRIIGIKSRVRDIPDETIVDRSDPVSRTFKIDVSLLPYAVEVAAGKQFLGPLRHTLDGVIMQVASPIRNSRGDIVAGVMAEVNLKKLERIVTFSALGDAGYLLLVEENGDILAASRPDLQKQQNIKSVELVAAVLAGKARDGLGERDRYKGLTAEQVIGAGIKLAGLPLALVAEWPEEDALRVARDIRYQALVFSLFVFATVLVISLIVSRRITQPIHRLREEARIIGEGRFDERVEVKTGDELEDLDDTLHEMADALKKLEELREEFVFIAAHELRSPVTAIKGYLSMVLEDGKDLKDDTKQMLEQVQRANQHLVQLVQDLLEVSRADAGRMQIEVAPQNMPEMIRTVISDLKPLWEEKKLAVTYQEFAELAPVLADPDKLREVLVNLVSNATKYNRDGGSITIWHEVSNGAVTTHVADTGIGMAQEELAKLFQKFYRAENTETRKVQGTGLGQ